MAAPAISTLGKELTIHNRRTAINARSSRTTWAAGLISLKYRRKATFDWENPVMVGARGTSNAAKIANLESRHTPTPNRSIKTAISTGKSILVAANKERGLIHNRCAANETIRSTNSGKYLGPF